MPTRHVVELQKAFLEEYKRTHTKEDRATLFRHTQALAEAQADTAWARFAAGMLESLDSPTQSAALETLQGVCAAVPKFATAWFGSGSVLRDMRKYEEAMAAYDTAIALDQSFVLPWNGRGNVLRAQARHDEALAAYDKAIALDPSYAVPWSNKGMVLRNLGRYDEALAAYDKAIALDPSYAVPWSYKGMLLRGLDRYDEALAAYDKAIALDPSSALPWCGRGHVLRDQDKHDEGLAAYDKAMALDPSFALPWWGRGNVLRDQDKYDEALAAYDRAIALDPSSALPWNGRGNVLRDQAKYEEALTAYDKAIALDPSFSLPRSGKANVLRGQEKYDEALTAYDEAIALDRASALPWNGRGNVLRNLKRDDDALAAYDKAIALAPSFALPWNGRGNVLRALKRDDEALAAYDKAIALDPSFALPWSNRGNVLRGLRRYDEAIASYDRAVALDPSTGSFYYNKGLVLWSLHRRGAAHTAFRLALERGWDPRWMRVVEMWVQRTAPSKSQAGRKPSAKVAPAERRRSTRPEVPSAGLGADLYETLMDLGLLEAVEESREEMRLALQRGLGAPRRIGVTAEQGALYILRDWNSYTPILPAAFRPQAAASPSMRLGGGYLLSWRGHGVAIDPGINFVDQLYRRGLSIADIDSVVVTHCHLDHTRDVEALVDLNYRFNRNRGATPGADAFRELRFYLARAAHTKYVEYLIGTGCCKEPELMYGGRGPKRISDHIEVRPIRVHHQDISSMDEAIGLVFALKQAQGEPLLVGLTSDSRSEPTLAARFRGCAVLLAHLGTLETAEEFQTTGLKNHLGLRGCHSLMQGVEPTLFVIGEFGEELLESRLEIVRVMAKHKPGKTFSVLGADSNLTIALGSRLGVLCSHPACRQSPTKIPLESVVPVIGNDGLFQYYCPKHSARPE